MLRPGPRPGPCRRWLDDILAADFAVGALTTTVAAPQRDPPGFPVRAFGVTADVALGAGDLVGVVARVELLPAPGHSAAAAHAGVRLGSYAALVGTAAALLGIVAILLANPVADY